jgi:hypothetical protein
MKSKPRPADCRRARPLRDPVDRMGQQQRGGGRLNGDRHVAIDAVKTQPWPQLSCCFAMEADRHGLRTGLPDHRRSGGKARVR